MLVWAYIASVAPAAWSVVSKPYLAATIVGALAKRVIVVSEEARCDRTHIELVIYDEGYDVIPAPRGLAR